MTEEDQTGSEVPAPVEEAGAPAAGQMGWGSKQYLIIGVIVVVVVGILLALFTIRGPDAAKVVVSVPLGGSGGRDILNGITLALEEADYRAGDVRVELVPLDDGNAKGVWQEDLEGDNAEVAAADEAVVAYLGPFNSGAAEISMPILNQAGIVQISPGNTWPGLTKEGFLPGQPDIFYPTGERHYVRVVPTDDFQGPAAAIWAKDLGFNSVYIVDDGEAYGKGIADLFRTQAETLGMTILGQQTIDKTSTDFPNEVAAIGRLKPDLVYYGGITVNGVTHLLKQMRAAGIASALMGPDGILGSDFIVKSGAENAEGVYVTTVGALPLDVGTPEAQAYHQAYIDRFGEEPEVFGLFGYEATQVVLAAIERAGAQDRATILEEVKATKNFAGLFGLWSFDERGDTTLKLMSGNVVRDGEFEFVKTLQVP